MVTESQYRRNDPNCLKNTYLCELTCTPQVVRNRKSFFIVNFKFFYGTQCLQYFKF